MNLQEYRKRKFRYIKDFAAASGYGSSKASGILRGLYHMTLSKDEVRHVASVLGISFVECADACDNTYAELKGYKAYRDDWKKTARTHKGIWARWQWEDILLRDTKKAAESGDWTEYRKKYWTDETFARGKGGSWSSSDGSTWSHTSGHTTSTADQDCFSVLGVPSTATVTQIKAAFRAKVKAASDGKGGFHGDMDKLVQAKEQALQACLSVR
jgi:hypothetical protein